MSASNVSVLASPVLSLALALASGCGDDDGAGPVSDAGAQSDGGEDGRGMDGSGPGGLRINGKALEFGAGMSGSEDPLADAEVCILDSELDCVMTDDSGDFSLIGVETDSEVVITIDKQGFVGSARSLSTGSSDMGIGDTRVISVEDQDSVYLEPLGLTRDADKATVMFGRLAIIEDGTRVMIAPASGTGPHFVGSDERPDPDLDSLLFWGFQAGVDPGEYTIELDNPDGECIFFSARTSGYPVEGRDSAARVIAPAGYISWIAVFVCEAGAGDAGAGDAG